MKRIYSLLFILIWTVAVFSCPAGVFAKGHENIDMQKYRVLCLLSYNYSYDIVPSETDGIEAGLFEDDMDLRVSLTYECMDAKTYYKADDIQAFYDYLAYKLDKVEKYDLLIAVDDTALRFAMNNRNTLFADMPIVFMGVNSIADAETAAALDRVTGVAEVPDLEGNYKLMKKLFPERDTIVAIVDGTNTGQGEYVQFMRFISNYPDQKYKILNTSRYSEEGVRNYLSELGDDTIILFLDFGEDGDGNIYTLESASKFVSDAAPMIPVFRTSSADLGRGVLGGVSYSFYNAGKTAGEMAASILTGADVSEIEMVSDKVTITYFDQFGMDRFGIKLRDIPSDAIVLNERFTITKWYKENTLIGSLVVVVCVLMITIIIILTISKMKSEKIANKDALTGISNRLYFNKMFKSAVSRKDRFAIIMVDVDYFKQINDSKGHQVGDEVLKYIGNMLKCVAYEKGALASRIGGDEFTILAKGVDRNDCIEICKEISEKIKKPVQTSEGDVLITLSMGGAVYPDNTDDPRKVMALADEVLYHVKEDGRNGYRIYDSQ